MSDDADRDYKVGYCKPPLHTRFKKGGPSPNPSGRPKDRKDLAAMVDRIANEPVQVKGANSSEEMPRQEAFYRRRIQAAVNGDQRATKWLIREIKACGLILPKLPPEDEARRGWLVVPGMLSPEEFERQYSEESQLARFAANAKRLGSL